MLERVAWLVPGQGDKVIRASRDNEFVNTFCYAVIGNVMVYNLRVLYVLLDAVIPSSRKVMPGQLSFIVCYSHQKLKAPCLVATNDPKDDVARKPTHVWPLFMDLPPLFNAIVIPPTLRNREPVGTADHGRRQASFSTLITTPFANGLVSRGQRESANSPAHFAIERGVEAKVQRPVEEEDIGPRDFFLSERGLLRDKKPYLGA